jgi:hypothetical protein
MEPTWLFPSSDWKDALWTATTVFLGLAGLQVLLWPFSPDPLEWVEVLEAALLGLWVGLISWAGPHVRRLLQPVSPQQLRVTLTALFITVGFFGMGMIMSIGEAGAFLANGLLWLGLFLPLGFVLAVIGASRKKSGYPVEST